MIVIPFVCASSGKPPAAARETAVRASAPSQPVVVCRLQPATLPWLTSTSLQGRAPSCWGVRATPQATSTSTAAARLRAASQPIPTGQVCSIRGRRSVPLSWAMTTPTGWILAGSSDSTIVAIHRSAPPWPSVGVSQPTRSRPSGCGQVIGPGGGGRPASLWARRSSAGPQRFRVAAHQLPVAGVAVGPERRGPARAGEARRQDRTAVGYAFGAEVVHRSLGDRE